MRKLMASITRQIVNHLVFKKSLDEEFGSARLFVAPRADLRLLYPGYDRAAFDLMLVARNYVRPGQCIWDIGSNLGIFSACAAYKTGVTGEVCSLEADPKYVSIQNRTFSALPPAYAPAHALCAAAADRSGVLSFAVSRQGHARSHLAEVEGQVADDTDRFQQVMSIKLDSLLEHWRKPDFIKIDVEGAEKLVMQGAAKILKDVRPVFYIEVSDNNRDDVTDTFLRADYEIFKLNADGSETPIEKCGLYTIVKPKKPVNEQ